jgi:hypothetical protein
MRRICFGLALGVIALLATAAVADTFTGRASVIDGDTIEIHGQRIRVFDIDAPESGQACIKENGEELRCGQQAALRLGTSMAHMLDLRLIGLGAALAIVLLVIFRSPHRRVYPRAADNALLLFGPRRGRSVLTILPLATMAGTVASS